MTAQGSAPAQGSTPAQRSVPAKWKPMTITVFLLDDHEIVRRGLRELLETTDDIVVVGESATAQEATRRIPALRPDVAIFDARLPDGSGIDACREVRSIDPAIKGLILTSYDDERAGLVDAIRRVAAGEDLLDGEKAAGLRRGWSATAELDPRLRQLTPQERRILDHVAAGLTNRQIGERLSLAEKTVKNYVTSVLGKLGMERRTQAAVFAATHTTKEPGRLR